MLDIPKIVAMYRVKNEEQWIQKSIESIYDFCSEIVVFNDNSTDKTKEICSSFDKVVEIHNHEHDNLDEARDRNFLLNMAIKRNPDYLLTIDGDEIFSPQSSSILLEEISIL